MTRVEIVSAMEQLAQQQAAIAAQLEQLQVRLNQLDDEERHEKINQITELLASASLQQVDYILNYLNAAEEIPTTVTVAPTPVAETVTVNAGTNDAVAVTEPEVVITPAGVPITYAEPSAQPVTDTSTEPTTPTSTDPANVEDYLVDGRIPWTDATISIVGLRHQDMWKVNHDSPQIGDRVKLYPPQRQDGRVVQSILAHTMEDQPRAIGILPQRAEKVAELEAIGAPVVKNRDAYADEAMRNGKMATVVGVIPGVYCFLKLDEEESAPSTPEPTPEPVAEPEPTIPEGVERILQGLAATVSDARRLFNEQKRDWWAFAGIEEDDHFFKINYLDHRCNSNDWMKAVAVAKAE